VFKAKAGADLSTQQAAAAAGAAVEQLRATEGLAREAAELVALADNLAKAVRFVEGTTDGSGRRARGF